MAKLGHSDASLTAALAVTAKEEGPRSPYFSPRRLGATAPHDCRLWSLDLRDGRIGEGDDDTVLGNEPVRRLEDPDLLDQLELLLDAGLRVSL